MELEGEHETDCSENVGKNRSKLVKFALYLSKNYAEAEDIVQETMLQAIKKKGQDENISVNKSYLNTFVRYKRISFWRKHGKVTIESLETENGAAFEIPGNRQEAVIRSEKSKKIDKAALEKVLFKKSTEEEIKIFWLYAVEGLSAEEIADVLNKDVEVVRASLNRVKNRVNKRKERFVKSHKDWHEEIMTIF